MGLRLEVKCPLRWLRRVLAPDARGERKKDDRQRYDTVTWGG